MKENLIVRTTEFAMQLLSEYIKPGDIVLDATMGNGLDTLALAELTGINRGLGKVYAFDIQQEAMEHTCELLTKNHFDYFVVKDKVRSIENIVSKESGSIYLYLESHEYLDQYIKEELSGAIFNLGYLPGGNKEITTLAPSTLIAIDKAVKLLKIDGLIVVVLYPGHFNGKEEKQSLLAYMKLLSPSAFHADLICSVNQPEEAPCIALITRKK
jgi:hypothetical protein